MTSAFLVLLAVVAAVQAPTSSRTVSGIVEDTQGGALPGATVTVTCGEFVTTVFTDVAGAFTAPGVPATVCAVEARADQFDRATVNVDLTTRSTAYARLVLRLSGIQTEVIVTASRGESEQAFAIPQATSIATREELESRPFQILPQALKEEPGILVQQTTTAQGSPFIRGFSAQRIVFLIDGVRLNTSTFRSGATQYLGWVDPNIVDRLEVVRGPASVQYGSDALGGTVNVLTVRPTFSQTGFRTSGEAEIEGALADRSAGGRGHVTFHGARAAVRIGGSGRHVGDLRTGNGRDSHAAVTRFLGLPSTEIDTRLRDSGFRQSGAQVAASVQVSSSATLNAIYLHEQQFGVSRYDRVWGGDGLFRSEFDPQRFDFAAVRYDRPQLGPLRAFAAMMSVNRQQDDRLEAPQPASNLDRESMRTLSLGYQAQAVQPIANRSALTVGGELYDEFIATAHWFEDPRTLLQQHVRPEVPDGSRYTSLGLFTQIAHDVGSRVAMRGGVRYGRFSFRTDEQPEFGVIDEHVASSAVTFNSGIVISAARWLNITGSINRGFRAANALDLGGIGVTGGGFEVSPRAAAQLGALIGTSDGPEAISTGTAVGDLGPEHLWAFELGAKAQSAKMSGSVTVFDLELRDAIQRRTMIFPQSIVGASFAGYTVVAQDGAGRAITNADPRPIVTRVNVERARIRGVEADVTVRITPEWIAAGNFAIANGRDIDTGQFMRRMPPGLGIARLKYEPSTSPFWIEGIVQYALRQDRLAPGDFSDARIGARRSLSTIADYFNGTATDLGLVRNDLLVPTGETLGQVQGRVLGGQSAAPLYTYTPGFVTLGARAGWKLTSQVDLTVIADNLTDRNYRWHGSGVDAPGINLQIKTRYRF